MFSMGICKEPFKSFTIPSGTGRSGTEGQGKREKDRRTGIGMEGQEQGKRQRDRERTGTGGQCSVSLLCP